MKRRGNPVPHWSKVSILLVVLGMLSPALPASANHGVLPPCEDAAGTEACGPLAIVPTTFHELTEPVPNDPPEEVCTGSDATANECVDLGDDGTAGAAPAPKPNLALSVNGGEPGIAGDDYPVAAYLYSQCSVSCGRIFVTLSFTTITGEILSLTQDYAHAASRSINFIIPGEYVYWWDTASRTPYVFGYWFNVTQQQSALMVQTRAPATPGTMYERAVNHTVVLTFRYENGTAASNIGVFWQLDREGPAGFVWTDSSGKATFTIPSSTYVQSLAQGQAYGNFFVWAYDSWPASPPTEMVSTSGYAGFAVGIVNLGDPSLPAADEYVRGGTVRLVPYSMDFGPGEQANADPALPCPTPQPPAYGCYYLHRTPQVFVEATGYDLVTFTSWGDEVRTRHGNVGGGWDMKTKFSTNHSKYMSSQVVIGAQAVITAQGEYATEESSSRTVSTNFVGPDENRGVQLQWEYHTYRLRVCVYNLETYAGGSGFTCTWRDEFKTFPHDWVGTHPLTDQSTSGFHDEMVQGDCWRGVSTDLKSRVGKGHSIKTEVGIRFEGEVNKVPLKARFSFMSEEQDSEYSQYVWRPGTGAAAHYIYVKAGGDPEDPNAICPEADPGATWTHSTNDTDVPPWG